MYTKIKIHYIICLKNYINKENGMKLKSILYGLENLRAKGDLDIDIPNIENDSRKVQQGDMFIAIRGFKNDGTEYILDAIKNGADEIDMVINLGWVKDEKFDTIFDEIKRIKAACGKRILKVIVETCLLSEEEKIKMCEIVTEAGADFIKTSTGFSKNGATFADVRLFAANVGENVRIKAAGGISSILDAEKFVSLGASRLGTSRIVKLVKNGEFAGH